MQKQTSWLGLIIIVVLAAIVILATIPLKLGLDLQGGSQITMQLKTSADVPVIDEKVSEAVVRIVENRVNALGVSEAIVQTLGNEQIIVQLPGVSDPAQAERVLGGTAQLDFREQLPGTEAQLPIELTIQRQKMNEQEKLKDSGDRPAIEKNLSELQAANEAITKLFKEPTIKGNQLKDAFPDKAAGAVGDNWNVSLRFNDEGGKNFAELTKNLAGTGRSIGVFLDNQLLSAPTVGVEFAETGIMGGSAIITGSFTAQEAQDLSVQLRGGALPVPVEIVENRTVGASLGRDSIQRSVYAGLGGLFLVLIFMVVYYRLPGLIADVSLIIYGLLTLASFALLGVTLSLPGIAGFILSIGMAVDANVLIFERTREELQAGKTLYRSVESGFYRAFSSILDGNLTTVIACLVLFWLGTGLVKGFAVTLGLGVMISMFTALTCSRTFLFWAISFPQFRKPQFFCPNLKKVIA